MTNGVDGLRSSYDAVIVGGRCAGAATALVLARAGLKVLVVEQGARGSDTLSTLALMRCGVLQLSRWGLIEAIEAAGTPRIQTTSFYYGDHAVDVRIKPRDGVDALYAPRRTVLDPLLADSASAAGAEVVYRVRLRALERDARGRVSGVVVEGGRRTRSIAAGIVIGADGATSTVAKDVGAEAYRVAANMSAVIYTRVAGVRFEGYQWHYTPGANVGVIPTNNGETVVFAAVSERRFARELRFGIAAGFRAVLRETAPSVAAAVDGAATASFSAFAGRRGFFRRSWGPGWALVGDAGYFKDPITAHGITDALRDAEALAHAVVAGTDAALAGYQAIRDDLSVPLFLITDEIASFEWDMPRVQALHKALSDEMAREVAHAVDEEGGVLALGPVRAIG